jgi:Response regulator containing CheY-like receiver, AAA-type ATPase, and DNA-binding domains
MKHRILVVEDDAVFVRPLQRTLESEGYEVRAVTSGEAALDRLREEDFDLVVTDKRLPKMDGMEVVRQIKGGHPDVAVVVMTAHATIESAVEALRLGAVDYLLKPFDLADAVVVIRHAIELQELRLAKGARVRRNQEQFSFDRIVARSASMREVFDLARSVVELDTTVLIEGETGVGKELLARAIHFSGIRRERPFVAVNCAAIPAELFESELFGFRKGAFTGASESRRGVFQHANGGTLLLDEIGEMPLHLQAKLLRVIEERRVTPLGAGHPVEVDVRILASTNRNLHVEVAQGRFRADLFYRLSVMPIRVPALRERPGDIPLLAEHFLEASTRRCKKTVRAIAPAAMLALCRYSWPGNARELENVIERAVIVAKGETILDVSRFLSAGAPERDRVDLALPFHAAKARVVDDFERAYIAGVLEAHGGKVGLAAKHAGLDPKNLSAKAARYGLRKGAAPAPGIPPTRATPAVAPPGRDRTETPIR